MSIISSRSEISQVARSEPAPAPSSGSSAWCDGERRPRVCHVIASSHGAQWLVEQLLVLRDRYGWDVTCIANTPEGALQASLRAQGIRCLTVEFGSLMLPPWRRLMSKSLRLMRLLRQERFDVVHTVLWHSMLQGRLAGWIADVPVRLTMVAGPFHLEAPITRWIDGATCWMETVLVGSCRYINELYRELGVGQSRLKLIYYGPDESRFRPDAIVERDVRKEYGWRPDAPVIAQVAWFYERLGSSRWVPATVRGNAIKGHEDLIRATPHIIREFPEAKIVLVGGGWLEVGQKQMDECKPSSQNLVWKTASYSRAPFRTWSTSYAPLTWLLSRPGTNAVVAPSSPC
jgi:glycosyltransferase involved in cell wall biosynthesis